jgi:phosphoserine phosphatase
METLVERKLIQQELHLASTIQRSTLPAAMPVLDGYAMFCVFEPAAATGGDTFDVALIDQGVLVVLGDATGHGIGPALSVTQMHAMLRMAFTMGADLETAFARVNDRLAQTLSDGHFVTAFVGLLDPQSHRLRFLSGGQGPILHLRAADNTVDAYRATSFPMGAMPLRVLKPAVEVRLDAGDWLVLLSDGIYEYANASGEMFGRARVDEVLHAGRADTVERMAARLMDAVRLHAGDAPQEDDITVVLVKRLAAN